MAAQTGARRVHATCTAGGSDTITLTGVRPGADRVRVRILSRDGAATLWYRLDATAPVPTDPASGVVPPVAGAERIEEVDTPGGTAVVSVGVAAGLSAVAYTVEIT